VGFWKEIDSEVLENCTALLTEKVLTDLNFH